jgi:cell division septum initiation protein DivIVA
MATQKEIEALKQEIKELKAKLKKVEKISNEPRSPAWSPDYYVSKLRKIYDIVR